MSDTAPSVMIPLQERKFQWVFLGNDETLSISEYNAEVKAMFLNADKKRIDYTTIKCKTTYPPLRGLMVSRELFELYDYLSEALCCLLHTKSIFVYNVSFLEG